MEYKKQIGKNILAVVLFAALMLPSAIRLIHSLDRHEHTVCHEKATHFHQDSSKCEVCSFHFVPINYSVFKYPDLQAPHILVKREAKCISFQYHSFTVTNTQLRAPPVFS
jgi:hypothetical protein